MKYSLLLPAVLLTAALGAVLSGPGEIAPPVVDYCRMLERDIAGKQHGFLAGKHLYYCGGAYGAEWQQFKSETIGFTHPMFRDGRARGYGIAKGEGGEGHDLWGWEFWRDVKAACGTIIVNGQRYERPKPISMIWRPDRHVCVYEVGGVRVEETKYISKDDVLCSIIKSDKPIEIEFEGRTYWHDRKLPTHEGDPANTPHLIESTAEAAFDKSRNILHLREGGKAWTKPIRGTPVVEGRLMYDGLHVALAATQDFSESHNITTDKNKVKHYTFKLECDPSQPLAISYAVGDDYDDVSERTRRVLGNPERALEEKTLFMNGLLNDQIPYFRCSDENAVKVYYNLWALYFMYFTDGEGWEKYPHTQTAVNNFMGLHLWDSWAYTAMGSWVADKWSWGHGNVLSWQFMVPFKSRNGSLPDNFGTVWHNPKTRMNFVGATEFAWQQFEHSGDMKYLDEVYNKLFRPLYWEKVDMSFGIQINALDAMISMAKTLGQGEDVSHWEAMRAQQAKIFPGAWEGYAPGYYAGKGLKWKDIWHLASMMCKEMPDEWAQKFTDLWVMNTETGFLGEVPLEIRPPDTPENGPFTVSSISTWLAVEGMFRHKVAAEAVHCTLGHIRGMHSQFGYPVAPEAWDREKKAWGSMYYNWDGAIVPLFIERLAGVAYDLPDSRFTVRDHLPDSWSFVETYTPVVVEGQTNWVHSKIERTGKGKRVTVKGSPLKKLKIETWLEDREWLNGSSDDGYTHLDYEGGKARVDIELGARSREFNTLALLNPHAKIFDEPIVVEVKNLHMNDVQLRYSTDGSVPTANSPIYKEPLRFTDSTKLTIRGFGDDGTVYRPMSAEYKRIALSEASKPSVSELRDGLFYSYYEGDWRHLPDFSSMQPTETGYVDGLSVMRPKGVGYALRFQGYIEVPKDGVYRFIMRSDDGARVMIDGQTVTKLEGASHLDAWEDEGDIGLKAGLHRIDVEYFQYRNNRQFKLSYELDGGKPVPVNEKLLKTLKK